MVDYVDIRETYMVAGDFDSRKRYVMVRAGASNPLAVCSGVTWTLGLSGKHPENGSPYLFWRWRIAGRGDVTFTLGTATVSAPTPQVVTSCRI